MLYTVRSTGKRPREAFSETITSISKKFKSSSEYKEIVTSFPCYNEVRRQLARHRSLRSTPVPDPFVLPEELTITLRGRDAPEGDSCHTERFLLYSGQEGRLQVSCAESELAVLHQSTYLVCDGTFEMAPDSAFQLYTIHGFNHGEPQALCWALLPNKAKSTYVEMLTALRSALEVSFGNIGQVKQFNSDFEVSFIDAVHDVFPEVIVKGCSFHFRQALMRHIQQEGFHQEYADNDVVKGWIRRIMAMSMLPAFVIPLAWTSLQHPPTTGDVILFEKLIRFSAYFERTWVSGPFVADLWTHFDNEGPRTTNVAEGWHSGLNKSFGISHPSPRMFLSWLQTYQNEVAARGLQLQAGRPPKRQAEQYERLNKQITNKKLDFGVTIGRVFAYVYPHVVSCSLLNEAIAEYLNHVAYFLVGA